MGAGPDWEAGTDLLRSSTPAFGVPWGAWAHRDLEKGGSACLHPHGPPESAAQPPGRHTRCPRAPQRARGRKEGRKHLLHQCVGQWRRRRRRGRERCCSGRRPVHCSQAPDRRLGDGLAGAGRAGVPPQHLRTDATVVAADAECRWVWARAPTAPPGLLVLIAPSLPQHQNLRRAPHPANSEHM